MRNKPVGLSNKSTTPTSSRFWKKGTIGFPQKPNGFWNGKRWQTSCTRLPFFAPVVGVVHRRKHASGRTGGKMAVLLMVSAMVSLRQDANYGIPVILPTVSEANRR